MDIAEAYEAAGDSDDPCAALLESMSAMLDEKDALIERLKLEAQMHAGEARTANATIGEIYQAISGATGEPGNWNGAEPVLAYVAAKDATIARLRAALGRIADGPWPDGIETPIDQARFDEAVAREALEASK